MGITMKRQGIGNYQPSTPGDEERKARIKARGLESLRRVKSDSTWEDWRGIGEAMMLITEEAASAIGAEAWDDKNKRLIKEFNRRWEAYEASGSNIKPLTKQERWALRQVMTNLPMIEAWRGELKPQRKRRLNYPNQVLTAWKRATPHDSPPGLRQLRRRGEDVSRRQAERALDDVSDYFRSLTDDDERAAWIERLKALIAPPAEPEPAPRRKDQARSSAKALTTALDWKDLGPGKGGSDKHHLFRARAVTGIYSINPSMTLDQHFTGFTVFHMPTRTVEGSRQIASRVKNVEAAKALAQADHDAGRDR